MLHINLRPTAVATILAFMLAGLLAGCGGGGGHADGDLTPTSQTPPDEVSTTVDGFALAQSLVNGESSESDEPQAMESVELSSSDSDEPDPRI